MYLLKIYVTDGDKSPSSLRYENKLHQLSLPSTHTDEALFDLPRLSPGYLLQSTPNLFCVMIKLQLKLD